MKVQELHLPIVCLPMLVMQHSGEELSEDISADVQLLLSVCHVITLVGCEDPDCIDVAVEESSTG